MASSFTTNQQHQQPQHTSNLVGPDIKLIASSFVKQYYTLLNKAPCFIHNFYNHDSTFIHGTIEMGNEHPTEPVIGREQIENKMKELKLNDCRAKIKQIDCLETLAGGLVIQVIGELSNNGRPMRRFLQTFVLAPSPDQTRHDGDSKAQMRTTTNTNATNNTSNNNTNDNRRSVQISENSTSSSHNQKFYVLNSIFRYQDDGPDSEFEDDSVSVQANTSIESANGANNEIDDDNHNIRAKPVVRAQQQQQQTQQSVAPITSSATALPAALKQPTVPEAGPVEPSKRVESCQTTKSGGPSNGTSGPQVDSQNDKKIETSEKTLTENGKFSSSDNQSQVVHPPKGDPGAASVAAGQGTVSTVVAQQSSISAHRPSNEPKTWANMVRNALPSSSTVQVAAVTSSKEQQASPNQAHHTQNNQQNPQHPTQQNEHQQNTQNNNNNNNNRRRHIIRKPSNKTGAGRTMKNRNPRPQASIPTTATPAAPTGKPTA